MRIISALSFRPAKGVTLDGNIWKIDLSLSPLNQLMQEILGGSEN